MEPLPGAVGKFTLDGCNHSSLRQPFNTGQGRFSNDQGTRRRGDQPAKEPMHRPDQQAVEQY